MSFFATAATVLGSVYFQVAVLAFSVVHQKKLSDKAKKAADAAKGFQVVVSTQIANVPVVYGRALVGGARVFHEVRSDYLFNSANVVGPTGIIFLSQGGQYPLEVPPTNVAVSRMDVYLHKSSIGVISAISTVSNPSWGLSNVYIGSTASSVERVSGVSNLPDVVISSVSSLSRPSPLGLLTLTTDTGKPDLFLKGGDVAITHIPFDTPTYWTLNPKNGSTVGIGTAKVMSYLIEDYSSATGLLTLRSKEGVMWNGSAWVAAPGYKEGRVNNSQIQSLSATVTGTKNEFLFINQVLCVEGIQAVYAVDLSEKDIRHPDFGATARVHVYTDGSHADPTMVLNFPAQSQSKFKGVAHASMFFRLNRDKPQFQGVPDVQFYIEGMKVRTFIGPETLSVTKAYTNNPALILIDYLTNGVYGAGVADSALHLKSFQDAAAICDMEMISNWPNTDLYDKPIAGKLWTAKEQQLGAPLIRRVRLYECNLSIDTGEPVRENVKRILGTMRQAQLVWTEGKYKLRLRHPVPHNVIGTYSVGDVVERFFDGAIRADLYESLIPLNSQPVTDTAAWTNGSIQLSDKVTAGYVTDDDIVSDGEMSHAWPSLVDRLNFCTISFLNEDKDFKEDTASWPPKNLGDYSNYMLQDRDQLLETSLFVDGITIPQQAKAMAEETVRASRFASTLTFKISNRFFYLEPGDIIQVDSEALRLAEVLFSVIEVKAVEGHALELTCTRFNSRVIGWDPNMKDIAVTPNTLYNGRTSQASNVTYTNPPIEISSKSSGRLSWNKALQEKVVGYNIYYAEGPKNAHGSTTTWNYVGTSQETSYVLPVIGSGVKTLAVVPATTLGELAPVYDMVTGNHWAKVTLDIPVATNVDAQTTTGSMTFGTGDGFYLGGGNWRVGNPAGVAAFDPLSPLTNWLVAGSKGITWDSVSQDINLFGELVSMANMKPDVVAAIAGSQLVTVTSSGGQVFTVTKVGAKIFAVASITAVASGSMTLNIVGNTGTVSGAVGHTMTIAEGLRNHVLLASAVVATAGTFNCNATGGSSFKVLIVAI